MTTVLLIIVSLLVLGLAILLVWLLICGIVGLFAILAQYTRSLVDCLKTQIKAKGLTVKYSDGFGSELIRLNPGSSKVEYSTNNGRSWKTRSEFTGVEYLDLLVYGNELLACTDDGLYYSRDKGRHWARRCSWSLHPYKIISIQDGGHELLGKDSDDHLYYSTNKGLHWKRRS